MLTSLIYKLKCEEGDSLFQTLSERNGKVRAFQKRNLGEHSGAEELKL